jgi:raffinose/stachyose/melibiose transport system permease protein
MAVSAPPARTDRRAGRAVLARPARRRSTLRKKVELTLLLGPSLVLFVGFVLAPMGIAIYYSFYSYNGFVRRYLGLRNYHDALTDPAFQHSIEHNFIIAGLSLVVQLPLAIAIALLLSRKMRGRAFLRLVTFAPYVIAEAIAAVIWLLMLQPDGFVDHVLKSVGLGALVHDWLASQTLVLYTLFVVLTWKYLGFTIILLVAGLQGIPPELREAAAIDGASPWQATRRVVLPLLGPTTRIAVFLSMIGSLQLFDMVWIMTQGGPADASSTMGTYMMSRGFQRYEYGYGSAVSVVLFVICFVFALMYQRFALRRDIDGSLTHAAG